jgi:hypothetical protein
MTEVLTGALLVVHRDCNEPPFLAGWFVIGPNGEVVAGPLETADEAEEAARQGRIAVRYRRE